MQNRRGENKSLQTDVLIDESFAISGLLVQKYYKQVLFNCKTKFSNHSLVLFILFSFS